MLEAIIARAVILIVIAAAFALWYIYTRRPRQY